MGFWEQNRWKGGAILIPNELVFTFGVFTSVPILVKIDQEMRPWECSQTDRHTHTLTDTQTQTDFLICPMLYAITMGQIMMMIISTVTFLLYDFCYLLLTHIITRLSNHSARKPLQIDGCIITKTAISTALPLEAARPANHSRFNHETGSGNPSYICLPNFSKTKIIYIFIRHIIC